MNVLDTAPCVATGKHLATQRHAQSECPVTMRKEGVFGWRKRVPSKSEQFGQTLLPTPLAQHLMSLHAILLLLGAEDQPEALEIAEHNLREIARFTRPDPFAPKPRRGW